MVPDILLLLAALLLILLAASLFTNGIEIFGHRLRIHQGVVGSVLAAIGTAMPETVIPIIAIILAAMGGGTPQSEASRGVAVGAVVARRSCSRPSRFSSRAWRC